MLGMVSPVEVDHPQKCLQLINESEARKFLDGMTMWEGSGSTPAAEILWPTYS
jgi:hypothetical protein